MTYSGTMTITDPMLVETITDIEDGFIAYVRYDDHGGESPREWGGRIATMICENNRLLDIDTDDAGLREARSYFNGGRNDVLMRRYLAMFRPDILHYVDYWSYGREGYGWGYITREAWDAAMGADYAGDLTPQTVFDQEIEEYRQWAEGEIYGVTVVHEESGEDASLWSIYDQDGSYIRGEIIPDLIEEVRPN